MLKAQQNQAGDYRYCCGIIICLFLAKVRRLYFQNAKNGIPLISQPDYGTSASLRYVQRQENEQGDTDVPFTVTVYRLMAKQKSRFFICLGFRWLILFLLVAKKRTRYVFSSSSKECKVQQIHVVLKHFKAISPSDRTHVTDTNNPQPRRQGVIKRT